MVAVGDSPYAKPVFTTASRSGVTCPPWPALRAGKPASGLAVRSAQHAAPIAARNTGTTALVPLACLGVLTWLVLLSRARARVFGVLGDSDRGVGVPPEHITSIAGSRQSYTSVSTGLHMMTQTTMLRPLATVCTLRNSETSASTCARATSTRASTAPPRMRRRPIATMRRRSRSCLDASRTRWPRIAAQMSSVRSTPSASVHTWIDACAPFSIDSNRSLRYVATSGESDRVRSEDGSSG